MHFPKHYTKKKYKAFLVEISNSQILYNLYIVITGLLITKVSSAVLHKQIRRVFLLREPCLPQVLNIQV